MTDLTIHKHLLIEHGGTNTYVNVFRQGEELIQVIVGHEDVTGDIKFNSKEFFFTPSEFKQLSEFFSGILRNL